jgi:hypothetical protein
MVVFSSISESHRRKLLRRPVHWPASSQFCDLSMLSQCNLGPTSSQASHATSTTWRTPPLPLAVNRRTSSRCRPPRPPRTPANRQSARINRNTQTLSTALGDSAPVGFHRAFSDALGGYLELHVLHRQVDAGGRLTSASLVAAMTSRTVLAANACSVTPRTTVGRVRAGATYTPHTDRHREWWG